MHAGGQQFRNVQHAVRSWGLGGDAIEFLVTPPEFESALWLEDPLNYLYDLSCSDKTRIGDVVNAERRAPLPQIETGADKVSEVRDRVNIVVNLRVTLDFGEVVARVVE